MPRLRFPGFSKEWEGILFGKAFDFQQTNTFSRNQMNTQKGKVRNIHYGDVLIKYDFVLRDISTIPFVNENVDTDKYKNSYLQNGDVVIADTAEDLTAGKAVEVQDVDCNILAGLHTMLCRPNEQAAPGFWGYYINSPAYHNSIIPLITGSKVSSISKSNIIKTSVVTTDFAEQKKIADCLSSLEDLITAEDNKLEALRAHKKGLMQKLFPAEGQTVPEWRFPEYRNSGEWEAISLIDVTDRNKKWSFSGGPFGSNLKASDYTSDGIRVIQLQNIGDGKFIDTYKIFTSERKADDLLSCNIYPNEIIISKMGDPVGRACLIPDTYARYLMCSDGIRLVVDENDYVKYFIYSLLNSTAFRSTIEDNSTGSTRKRIGLDVLKNLTMFVPKKPEQQKIADCLSSIDDLISAQAEKIEALKAHKKGLLQGLFPSTEEVGE